MKTRNLTKFPYQSYHFPSSSTMELAFYTWWKQNQTPHPISNNMFPKQRVSLSLHEIRIFKKGKNVGD